MTPEAGAAHRPCARFWGSDGTLCATHNGRFLSPSETRCTKAEAAHREPEPDPDDLTEPPDPAIWKDLPVRREREAAHRDSPRLDLLSAATLFVQADDLMDQVDREAMSAWSWEHRVEVHKQRKEALRAALAAEPIAASSRLSLRQIVHDWFETGYDAGTLNADVLADRLAAEPIVASSRLDEAWAEAEAALPEGWLIVELERSYRLTKGKKPGLRRSGWMVKAHPERNPESEWAFGPTPAAALRALAERLRATPEPEG